MPNIPKELYTIIYLCIIISFEDNSAMHWEKSTFCCAFHKNYYNHSTALDSGSFIGYNGVTIKLLEVTAMLKTPELAMPRSNKVTTVCNGKREVWTDYEEAKAYFLELMLDTSHFVID